MTGGGHSFDCSGTVHHKVYGSNWVQKKKSNINFNKNIQFYVFAKWIIIRALASLSVLTIVTAEGYWKAKTNIDRFVFDNHILEQGEEARFRK